MRQLVQKVLPMGGFWWQLMDGRGMQIMPGNDDDVTHPAPRTSRLLAGSDHALTDAHTAPVHLLPLPPESHPPPAARTRATPACLSVLAPCPPFPFLRVFFLCAARRRAQSR